MTSRDMCMFLSCVVMWWDEQLEKDENDADAGTGSCLACLFQRLMDAMR